MPWHFPTSFLEPHHPFFKPNVALFTVVRNPYDRAVSLYYCPFAGYKGKDKNNVEVFNKWIQDIATNQPGIVLMPQYQYIYNSTEIEKDNPQPMVDHILRYENLTAEFNDLMKTYILNISLPPVKYNKGQEHKFSASSLSQASLKIIQKYRLDILILGY